MTSMDLQPQTASVINSLPHIEAVAPLDDADRACFAEIRAALEKHGKLERFGVALLHKHFDLKDGECLVELTDENKRVSRVMPMTETDVPPKSVETLWRLDAPGAISICVVRCYYYNTHNTEHHFVP